MEYNRKNLLIGIMRVLQNHEEEIKFRDLIQMVGEELNYSDEIVKAPTLKGTKQFDTNVSYVMDSLKKNNIIDNKTHGYWKMTNEKDLSIEEVIRMIKPSETVIKVNTETNADILKRNIYSILEKDDHIKKLKSDKVFYFENAIKEWDEFINYDISSEELEEILATINNPFKDKDKKMTDIILEMNSDSKNKYNFINIMCTVVAYIDSSAYNKDKFNKYDDKRAMARTYIWQDKWFKNLIQYKKNKDIKEMSDMIKNIITFLYYPEKKLSSFKTDKLKDFVNIFNNTTTVDYDVLCEKVYNYFNEFNINVVNEKNRGLIYGHIIYLPQIRILWENKKDEEYDYIEENTTYEVKDEYEEYIKEEMNYSKDDIFKEVFIDKEKLDDIIFNLDYKKNIILQGAPGVGKTFVAKRLCYLHQGYKSDSNIEMVQFHQSYSYEDFIRGYRPNKGGGFSLKNGVFYDFTKKAQQDPENNYYFIIDEINRGNLSKIFGELMMLIERDKRGRAYGVTLTYQEDNEERFYIPDNLYIIGSMNTADRSLAMVDYALRRRFAFIDIDPAFESDSLKIHFENYLGVDMTQRIISKISNLNNIIEKESINLGKGYRIGHSYFTPTEKIEDTESWYKRIIKMEIEPLIREYWFDESEEDLQKKVDDLLED